MQRGARAKCKNGSVRAFIVFTRDGSRLKKLHSEDPDVRNRGPGLSQQSFMEVPGREDHMAILAAALHGHCVAQEEAKRKLYQQFVFGNKG